MTAEEKEEHKTWRNALTVVNGLLFIMGVALLAVAGKVRGRTARCETLRSLLQTALPLPSGWAAC